MLISIEKRLKWDPKACEEIFMGYEKVSKAYRVNDIEAYQVVISRNITFDESTFSISTTLPQELWMTLRCTQSR